MADAALVALTELLDPFRLMMLFVGLFAGAVIGMLPGLGGVAAVSILLPFIYTLDAYSGLAMLLGALGVVYTADTITSVLVGTPGSPASAPTAIEGFAMARQGEAGRALSAAFLSSMIGGSSGPRS
jgi:putative tricarboxylic transport membrane protein